MSSAPRATNVERVSEAEGLELPTREASASAGFSTENLQVRCFLQAGRQNVAPEESRANALFAPTKPGGCLSETEQARATNLERPNKAEQARVAMSDDRATAGAVFSECQAA